ncbi:MAG TPA: hypothetical protein VGG19_01765 [Tepidisphaeraceae bacterium]|jgi:hypothetical protein
MSGNQYSHLLSTLESLEQRKLFSAHGISHFSANAPQPAINFLAETGFNAAGSTWTYDSNTHYGGHSANGTVTTSVQEDDSTSWDWNIATDAAGADNTTQNLTWEQGSSGVYLASNSLSTNDGYVNEDINFDNLQVCGSTLSKKFSSTSPVEIDTTDLPELDGVAKVTTSVLGNKKVTEPAGTFNATEISMVISYKASGSTDADDAGAKSVKVSAKGTDKQTFYVIDGVGIVKLISSASESATAAGHGTKVNLTTTSDLSSYDYETP